MGEEVEQDWIEQFGELAKFSIDKTSLEVFWITPEGKFVYVNETVKTRLVIRRKS